MIQILLLIYLTLLIILISFSRPKFSGRVFILTLVGLVLWGGATLLFRNNIFPLYNHLIANIAFLSAYFSAFSFLFFCLSFPFKYQVNGFFKILLSSAIAFLFVMFIFNVVEEVEIRNGIVEPKYSSITYPIYIVLLLTMLVSAMIVFFQKMQMSKKVDKQLIKLIFVGVLLTILFVIIFNILIPLFMNTSLYGQYGILGIIFLLTATTYAILKYQFLDIRILVGRISYFMLLAAILIGAYRITIGIDAVLWGDPYNIQSLITAVPLALIVVVFYDAFKKFIQEKIDSTLINPDFDPKEVISKFNNEVSTLLSYEDITDHALNIIGKTLRPHYKGMIVNVKDDLELTDDLKDDKVIDLNFDLLVKIWTETNNYPILLDQIEIDFPKIFRNYRNEIAQITALMKEMQIKILIPIASPATIVGILLIGQREADSPYNSVQVDYLESIANLTGLALTRAFLYEEVREFNETLKKKVEIATKALEKQNNKLKENLANERDMLDILGHELRTPLGIIRNALGLFEITYKSGKMNNEDTEKFIRIAQNNIRREIQLLETILASAKIDNAKLDLNLEKIDANVIAEDSFDAYKYESEKKNLKLLLSLPEEKLMAYADKLRIQQVLDNLVNNAIKYTTTGEVEIGLKDEGNFLRYYVRDTGIGIPKEDFDKLGQKFFRVNNYLESNGKIGDRKIIRPGGNGIGLYVVYQLVKYMGGEVQVESELGKGSTFGFTVPKFTSDLEKQQGVLNGASLTKPLAAVSASKLNTKLPVSTEPTEL